MIVKLSFSTLKDSRWYEYAVRFLLGGAVTAATGLISNRFGPSVGGLFLALPAIFCASATLIEKHEVRRKRDHGLRVQRRGQEAAALDAAGAVLGSFGMVAFAAAFSLLVQRQPPLAFIVAMIAWCGISVAAWWAWRHARVTRHVRVAGNLC
ncbi:MAG TPA: DUF3147 family protein [Bradyrhizobium sp.]|jgi:hypothetical protein